VSEDQKRQLALKFPSERRCTLDNFEVGPNAELIAALGRCGRARAFSAMWLVGESGSGKSHLLQGACHAAAEAGAAAAYLPARLMAGGVEALDGLGDFGVVAIDELERWVGQRRWEEALLNLYQQLLVRGGTLLVASRNRPLETTVGLADLDSRLRAAQVFVIRPLDDADRARAIERLAAQRGLELGADVVAFILRRAPRRMDELIATFDRLDRGALAQQRRLTIPLAKDVLGL
jgi:DnaA-homolog protein